MPGRRLVADAKVHFDDIPLSANPADAYAGWSDPGASIRNDSGKGHIGERK